MTNQQKAAFLDKLIALARLDLSLVLYVQGTGIFVGALNFAPTSEDWFYTPAKIGELTERESSVESSGVMETSPSGVVAKW